MTPAEAGAVGTAPRLQRSRGHGAAPVHVVHLGLGNFFRAHQAYFTARAPDAEQWGIAAFSGRRPHLAEALARQDGLFTLVTKGAHDTTFDVVPSISAAHHGGDHESWLSLLSSPRTHVLTMTVTEAAYGRAQGMPDLDWRLHDLRRDAESLCRAPAGGPATTVPGRIVAGLMARRAADAGPLTVAPCDNLSDNGNAVRRVVTELAERVDPTLVDWIDDSVSFVTSMVDRITPRTTATDLEAVLHATGVDDRCPVVTEPFAEWVMEDAFLAGRPAWERAGAQFVENVTPYEERKLWLLNGSHSLLAYAGSIRGHRTVAEAVRDETCRAWVEEWWDEASHHLSLPAPELEAYRAALLDRYDNPNVEHLLDQVCMDGSQKLPIRILPVVVAERAQGRSGRAGARVLAAWVLHLRLLGAPVDDPRAEELVAVAQGRLAEAVRAVLRALAAGTEEDRELVDVVVEEAKELSRS